jgi:Protein of unknown function (DUF1573)
MKKSISVSILGLAVLLFACDQSTSSAAEEGANNISNTAVGIEAQPTAATPTGAMPKFEFATMQHDFGNIKEGDVVKHTFKFKNAGDAPLIISNVQPQCGCTTTNYTKTPVPPNGEGEIELQFDSANKSGPQHKTATVMANIEGGQTQLVLTAIVASKPKVDGPFLKQ